MLKQISKTIISVVIFWLAFILSSLNSTIINKIEIIGNDRVSDQTIIVYGDIKVNEDINEQKLNQILNDLYSTDFFEDGKVQIKDNVLIIYLLYLYPIEAQYFLFFLDIYQLFWKLFFLHSILLSF